MTKNCVSPNHAICDHREERDFAKGNRDSFLGVSNLINNMPVMPKMRQLATSVAFLIINLEPAIIILFLKVVCSMTSVSSGQLQFFQTSSMIETIKLNGGKKPCDIRLPNVMEQSRARHIMLRDLLTQKCSHNKELTDFGYPRACRFRKHQIENRFPDLTLPTFFKT
jgi:hypothetical protein